LSRVAVILDRYRCAILPLAFFNGICAKVGLVAGSGLILAIKRFYPKWALYPTVGALALANVINAGVDIGAVAAARSLLVPTPPMALVLPLTVLLVALLIWGSYRLRATVLRWLTVSLFAYIAPSILAKPDFLPALQGTFIPHRKWSRSSSGKRGES